MSEKNEKEKLKIHFMYIVIMLVLSNVMIAAFLLFGKDNALAHLSSAGTLVSIVLGIVAILITLWDIAGQKNSIYEIREQIEKIKTVSDEIVTASESVKNNTEATDDILNSLKSFQITSGSNFDKVYKQIDQIIEELKESNGDKGENGKDIEKEQLLDQLNLMKDEIGKQEKSYISFYPKFKESFFRSYNFDEGKKTILKKFDNIYVNPPYYSDSQMDFKTFLNINFKHMDLNDKDFNEIYKFYIDNQPKSPFIPLEEAKQIFEEFKKNSL
ncbi:hypothetical protein ABH916_003434 [Peribacillus frigoritolerans]|uniref:hypothetical protein n=1 Tax=Peribacillus frigoritolerans TaxID=450367 RepID=UPI003836FD0D